MGHLLRTLIYLHLNTHTRVALDTSALSRLTVVTHSTFSVLYQPFPLNVHCKHMNHISLRSRRPLSEHESHFESTRVRKRLKRLCACNCEQANKIGATKHRQRHWMIRSRTHLRPHVLPREQAARALKGLTPKPWSKLLPTFSLLRRYRFTPKGPHAIRPQQLAYIVRRLRATTLPQAPTRLGQSDRKSARPHCDSFPRAHRPQRQSVGVAETLSCYGHRRGGKKRARD